MANKNQKEKEENIFQYRQPNLLSSKEQEVADFYDDNPLASRLDCSKHIYGGSNVFQLQNLSTIECNLRKKGYLYYTIDGKIVDMARNDVDIELKLRIQSRIGGAMIGNLKSGIRVISVARDPRQFEVVKNQFKKVVQILIDEKVISIPMGTNIFAIKPNRKLINSSK